MKEKSSRAVQHGTFYLLLTALSLVILILLIPYIRHYYILENEVQKMYGQYDRMRRLQQTAAGSKIEKPER